MSDLPDYELHRTPDESPEPTPSSISRPRLWVAAALLIAAAGGAAYIAFAWRPRAAPTPAATAGGPAAARPTPPLGGTAEPVTIPPLDASDAVVRTLVRALSDRPAVAAWLTTDGLIRNFTVVTANIADGATPA